MSGTRNTKKLCEQFEKGTKDSLNNVELLELKGKKINYCLIGDNMASIGIEKTMVYEYAYNLNLKVAISTNAS